MKLVYICKNKIIINEIADTLTINKIYDGVIYPSLPGYYEIELDDAGYIGLLYPKEWFAILEDIREEKLNELGI